MSDQNDAVRTTVERWAQGIRNKDYAVILDAHPDDLVMFDVPPPIESRGMDQYRATWDLFFEYSSGGPGSFELVDLTIHAGAEVAFAHALLKIGSPEPVCRLTLGLVRRDGEWLIQHEHHSAPTTE
jgi:ketosteroid isomerase-like protein